MTRWCAVIVLLFIYTSTEVLAGVNDQLRVRLQAKLDSLYAAGSFPGITVGISLADGTNFGLASGYTDKGRTRKLTTEDLLMQGSVGKTYVSAIALQLVREGKIALHDKIERHLGNKEWFSRLPNAKDITVRMLMNHTSGLVRYEFKEEFARDLTASPDKDWKPEEQVAYILGSAPPFAAGQDWEYSDTNYIVLGMIIEHVTGKKYVDLLRERILQRFQFFHTRPVESRTVPGLVQGYAGADNPFGGTDEMIHDGKFVFNPAFEWTGGGVASSSQDLARWGKLLYEGKAFDSSLMSEFLDGVPAKLGPNSKYGLGVIIRQTPAGVSYGHSGFFPGYLTDMMYFPDSKVVIAVQVNTSEFRTLGRPLTRFIYELMAVVSEKND